MTDTFNRNHPELREGEVLLTNITSGDFNRVGWKTKRCGRNAYDHDGKIMGNMFPVFVQISELQEAGIDISRFQVIK